MLPMKKIIIRNKRVVTYRRHGIPALILEGKWLTALYGLHIGDVVDIDHQKEEIRLKKNIHLSKERQKKIKELNQHQSHEQERSNESSGSGSTEVGQG